MKVPSTTALDLEKKGLRHMVTLQDMSLKELKDLLKLMTMFKKARKDNAVPHILRDKTIGVLFEAGSTRTRVSFQEAATLLGGASYFLSPKDIHLGSKETIEDTSRVLSRMVDAIVVRANKPETVDKLVETATVPIINALDTRFHPTQICADFFTIFEHMPDKDFHEITIAFMGDATDVCRSLMLAATKFGMNFKQIGPKKYQMQEKWLKMAKENAAKSGSKLEITDDIGKVSECNVIYGDSFYWTTQEDEKEERLKAFMPDYVITKALMDRAQPGALLCHCLPANDQQEVTREALEGPHSVVFDEAENRVTAELAILAYYMYRFVNTPTPEVIAAHKKEITDFLHTL